MTFSDDLLVVFRQQLEITTGIRWPAPQYRRQYVRFAREILGIQPWSKQEYILKVHEDEDRVAVKSGHRIGKSQSAAIIALCDYCAIEEMRVVMSSGSSRQVDEVLWRAIGMLHDRSGRCVVCKAQDRDGNIIPRPCPHSAAIDGTVPILARTGLRSPAGTGYRQIFGFSAKEGGKITGVAGAHMRFIFDEAAAIPQAIFDANEGNRAAGAWITLFGNPISNKGEFREAFRSKAYFRITVSSLESPNITGERFIKGLAEADWIEERKVEWGERSALYITKVLGEFCETVEGQIFPTDVIAAAEERWREGRAEARKANPAAGHPLGEGRLFIGLDPAGKTDAGDETVFTLRRGFVALAQYAFRGLSVEDILAHLLSFIDDYSVGVEQPHVNVDREGHIGAEVYGALRGHLDTQEAAPFALKGVRAGARAERQPKQYGTTRDELAASLIAWFQDGGAIPEDIRLAADLNELRWFQTPKGLAKLTPKSEIKQELGRSPDRYDSLALACWEPGSLRAPTVTRPPSAPRSKDAFAHYDAQKRGGRGAGPDPYAHYDRQRGR